MRILVVEDHSPLRRSLVQGLQEAGFAVDAAADGQEGLANALSGSYDTVVLDLMLPKVDGTDIKALRKRGNHTPVFPGRVVPGDRAEQKPAVRAVVDMSLACQDER